MSVKRPSIFLVKFLGWSFADVVQQGCPTQPEIILRLDVSVRLLLLKVYVLAELLGYWPRQVTEVLIPLLEKLAGGFRVDVFERAVGVEEKWQRLRKWRQKKLMERETPPQIFAEKNNAAPFRYTTA